MEDPTNQLSPSDAPADATPPADPAAAPPADPSPSDAAPADPAATDAAPSDVPGDHDDPDGGGGAAARIRGLLAETKALREYSAHWRELALGAQRGGAEAPSAAPASTQPAADPPPALTDFDSTEKWAAAHAAWTEREINRRAAAAVDTTLKTRESATREQEARESYARRLEEFEKVRPDARLVIANPTMTRALQQQPVIGEVVMASERGPELAVHLSENPSELVRISRLPPSQAAAAIGRLEAKLSPRGAAPQPPKAPARPPPSRAPSPPSPVSGAGAPSIDDLNLPLDEFLAKLNRRR